MVIQTQSLAYTQTDIQTISTQNFRQIFQILHGKKINPKSEKLRCIRLSGWPQNGTMMSSGSLGHLCEFNQASRSIHSSDFLAHFSILKGNF